MNPITATGSEIANAFVLTDIPASIPASIPNIAASIPSIPVSSIPTPDISTHASSWLGQASEGIYYLGHRIVESGREAIAFMKPYLHQLIIKSQEVWLELRPHLIEFVEFLKTPVGIACTLLVSTVILMQISQRTQSRLTSMIFMMCGIATSVLSGAYLLHSGLLPATVLIAF